MVFFAKENDPSHHLVAVGVFFGLNLEKTELPRKDQPQRYLHCLDLLLNKVSLDAIDAWFDLIFCLSFSKALGTQPPFRVSTCVCWMLKVYPAGNDHISPTKVLLTMMVGYVSSKEGIFGVKSLQITYTP